MQPRPLSRTDARLIGVALVAALLVGPIAQPASYHDFADHVAWRGISHAFDVLSNLGFVLIAGWGWRRLRPARQSPALKHGWAGYRLFLLGLALTAAGSAFYHLAPDNARLVWDRLPIALACAGLLAGVWGDTRRRDSTDGAALLALAAVISVAWWHFTELAGAGDLRPYLLLQAAPILLVPLWQWRLAAPGVERCGFGAALLLYLLAKWAELADYTVAGYCAPLTGHTLKHLLASAAALLIVATLVQRVRTQANCTAGQAH